MKIYMAGVIESHLGSLWHSVARGKEFKKAVKEFLGDGESEYFSGRSPVAERPYVLESFYYADAETERVIPCFGDFMIDSGAFTFMQNAKTAINWTDYARKYAAFIKKNNIAKYIELDLDYIIGCEAAYALRQYLEKETGRQSIPVWHPIRGKQAFFEMCEQYKYVALGGIVGKKWQGIEQYMPWFINEAHKRGAKIHGLGFTRLTKLPQYHFDSVDSTAWTTGNRFGFVYRFNGKTLEKINRPKGTRIKESRKVAVINYLEWIKFQQYADKNL